MKAIREIFHNRRDHERMAADLSKSIMHNLCMWADERKYKERTWLWIVCNIIGLFLQQFCVFTVAISLHLQLESVSDFGEYLNVLTGTLLAFSKMAFVMTYRKEVTELLDCVAELSGILKAKAQKDMEIRRLRNSYFLLESALILSSFAFSFIFEMSVYIQGLLVRPIVLGVPSTTPFGFHETTMGFVITYLFQFMGSTWVAMFMCTVDFMIGSSFDQLILNLKVMRHELGKLGSGEGNLNDSERTAEFIRIIKEYQNLKEVANRFNRCFEPYLLIHVLLAMVVVTFISIELAIVINVEPKNALRPLMYLIFMNSTFFYWCWLGDRLYHMSNEIPAAVFEFQFDIGDTGFKKLRLMTIQMTQTPLQIKARPFFILNYDIFLSVLRRSYSITAVLKDVNAKE